MHTTTICKWLVTGLSPNAYGDHMEIPIHTAIPKCMWGYVCFLRDGCTGSYVESKHLQPPPDLILSKIAPKEFAEKVFLK
jgi:hypothetical protein